MPFHPKQRHNQSADISDGFDDYIFHEPYPPRQHLNHTRTPWQGVGQSRLPGNYPPQPCESSYDNLLKAYRELQQELAHVKATLRNLQTENAQLQQELDIEQNTKGLNNMVVSSTITSKPPLDQMLEEAKPYIRKLVMLYYPFMTESITLGPNPPPGTLSPAVQFTKDVTRRRRPSQGDLFLAQLYCCLPTHLHDLVTGHTKFKTTFSKTAKNMKGHIVEELRKAAPLIIKGVDPAYFASKGDRSNVKELIALLSWERRRHVIDFLAPLLYPQEVRAKGAVAGYKRCIFQSVELFQFIRALLFGQLSLGGKVSKKSYSVVWGVTGVESLDSTIIPVFAVLVLCIISEDTEVTAVGARTGKKWQLLLEAYLGEFYKLRERKKEDYYRVMDLFEAIVFDKTPESREEEDLGSLNLFEDSAIFEDDEAELSWQNEVINKDSSMHDNPSQPTTPFQPPTPPPATPPPASPSPPPAPSPPATPPNLSVHPLQPMVPVKPRKRSTRAAPAEHQNFPLPLTPAAYPLPLLPPPPLPPVLPPLPLPPLPKVPPKPAKPRTVKAKPTNYPAHTAAQKESTTVPIPIPAPTTKRASKVNNRHSNKGKNKAAPNNDPPEQDAVTTDRTPHITGMNEIEEVSEQPVRQTLQTRPGQQSKAP